MVLLSSISCNRQSTKQQVETMVHLYQISSHLLNTSKQSTTTLRCNMGNNFHSRELYIEKWHGKQFSFSYFTRMRHLLKKPKLSFEASKIWDLRILAREENVHLKRRCSQPPVCSFLPWRHDVCLFAPRASGEENLRTLDRELDLRKWNPAEETWRRENSTEASPRGAEPNFLRTMIKRQY